MTYPNKDYEDNVRDRLQELPANYEQFLRLDRQQFDEFISQRSINDVLWLMLKLLRFVVVITRRLE